MSLPASLTLAAALFSIGLFGLLTRRQAVAMLIAIELMVNAGNIALVGFAHHGQAPSQVVVLFVLAITVAEAAVGLALIMVLYRRHQETDLDVASEARH